jgi:hypothetical protein
MGIRTRSTVPITRNSFICPTQLLGIFCGTFVSLMQSRKRSHLVTCDAMFISTLSLVIRSGQYPRDFDASYHTNHFPSSYLYFALDDRSEKLGPRITQLHHNTRQLNNSTRGVSVCYRKQCDCESTTASVTGASSSLLLSRLPPLLEHRCHCPLPPLSIVQNGGSSF